MKSISYHLKNIWRSILLQGVSGERTLENKTTISLNSAAAVTCIGSIIFAFSTFLLNDKYPNYYLFPTTTGILYGMVILFHRFKKLYFAKLYICFILCLWIYVAIITIGSFFSQSITVIATMILAFFFFPKNDRLRWWALGYNFVLYALSTTYAALYPPLVSFGDMPFDEVLVFFAALVWIKIIFSVHEFERGEFIQSILDKNEELKQTTEELERFTHIASHDLKSPLRTIISFLDLMQRDLKKERFSNLNENLSYAKSGAKQLNYLIKDVLEISKINTQTVKEKTEVDFDNTLNKVLLNIETELKEKNAKIVTSPLPSYTCNEVEFILLFQNLIQNGIKYNNTTEPTIHIWSEQEDGFLKIFFKDNGIGIEEKYTEYIFEHFKRLHTSSEYTGTGLGLSLCKKVIKSYKGFISVNSSLDNGSIFIVHLPIEKPIKLETKRFEAVSD